MIGVSAAQQKLKPLVRREGAIVLVRRDLQLFS